MADALKPAGEYDADIHEQFRAALHARGIIPPDPLLDDGKLHRCGTQGGESGCDSPQVTLITKRDSTQLISKRLRS